MASKLLGIELLIGFIYLGQFIIDAAMALSRAGSAKHILPNNLLIVLIIAALFVALEIILAKMENKGGYAE